MASPSLDSKIGESKRLHIVVFPWLAFGHMLPFLELSKSLAEKGHHIFDALQQPFSEFIMPRSTVVDWIILDFAPHWAPPIAASAGVPLIYFSIYKASTLVFWGCTDEHAQSRTTAEQFTKPPPWVPFTSTIAYRLHEARRIFNDSFETNSSGITDSHRLVSIVKACKAIAVRSSNEVEHKWFKLLAEISKKPVIPVGLLPPQSKVTYENEEDPEEKIIFKWLDEQKPGSVVYIAFGSEAELSDEQTRKLALGLELAKLPFLWAIRRPTEVMFPEGFKEKIMSRSNGLIVKGWVPQMKILAHGSVGGFLNHAGWSSAIESLQFGHPLVLFPVAIDQGLIAQLLVEKGVGVEVERDEGDGSFGEEEVVKAVRLVMVEEEGEGVRKRAEEWREVVQDKELQEKYIEGFVDYLVCNTEV